jgi:AcrR family transcriptional regulator
MTDRSVIFAGRRKGRRGWPPARSATVNRGPDRERKRQAILLAARQVFARKGYEPATLEEVAR